jgi:hypothetical protein
VHIYLCMYMYMYMYMYTIKQAARPAVLIRVGSRADRRLSLP